MLRFSKLSVYPSLFMLLLAISVSAQPVNGKEPVGGVEPVNKWWSISDIDFVSQYGSLATGNQHQQSQFAWMTFARVNQQVTAPATQLKFSQWELWASDSTTFTPDEPRFNAAKLNRTRPHLQPIQQLRMFSPHSLNRELSPFPKVGQEVTRNSISYDYIMDKKLNSQIGIAAFLGQAGNKIEFPLAAIETKAVWRQGSIAGAYQLGGLSLTGIHLMVKVKPTPKSPFTDNRPSWFWTTFELKSNDGLAAAQKFITYGDSLPANESQSLLQQAGLGPTPFINYVCNGAQIQFFDDNNSAIILGNTQLEAGFASPPVSDPTKWKKWSSSCHSCHAQASSAIDGARLNVFNFTAPVGPLKGNDLPGATYRSYDFDWALSLAQ